MDQPQALPRAQHGGRHPYHARNFAYLQILRGGMYSLWAAIKQLFSLTIAVAFNNFARL
jgi:hypothetical protein